MRAKSRSSPLISSLSDTPPLLFKDSAPGSALTLTEDGQLTICTLSVRTEGAYEQPLLVDVSEGMLVLEWLEGAGKVDWVAGSDDTHLLITKLCLCIF